MAVPRGQELDFPSRLGLGRAGSGRGWGTRVAGISQCWRRPPARRPPERPARPGPRELCVLLTVGPGPWNLEPGAVGSARWASAGSALHIVMVTAAGSRSPRAVNCL